MGFCMVKNLCILLSLIDPNIPAQCIQGCRVSQMSGLHNLKYLCLWERNKLWLHVRLGFRFSVMILSFLFNIIFVLFVYYDVFGTLAVPFDVQLWWQIILTINTRSIMLQGLITNISELFFSFCVKCNCYFRLIFQNIFEGDERNKISCVGKKIKQIFSYQLPNS